MRAAGDTMQGTDIKAVINSIVSASDLDKLSSTDLNDIVGKLESGGNAGTENDSNAPEGNQSQMPPQDGDINETEGEEENLGNMTNHPLFTTIIEMADLEYELRGNEKAMLFDFCEAAYLFIHDYNDNNELIQGLQSILTENNFKPRPSLSDKDQLEYHGDMIYDAMVAYDQKMSTPQPELHELEAPGNYFSDLEQGVDNTPSRFRASGGQSIGEDEMLEEIINRVKTRINNKSNNGR